MTSVLKMRAFPVASELFSPLTNAASALPGTSKNKSKTSLPIGLPRATKSSAFAAVLEMLGIFVCFALGLYVATQMYGFALGLMNTDLPRAFALCFCGAYAFQLYVGWLEVKEEGRWRERTRLEEIKKAEGGR